MTEDSKTLVGDFWGGLAAMLVALPSSVAFGILVYSALGPEYRGLGAMAGLLGAAALGLVTPFIGRTNGLISAPCAPSAAVLSALVAGLLAGAGGSKFLPSDILPLVAITSLLAALMQILYGTIGGGKLIKFIPYQVVSGYLSGVGLIIALGQLPKLFGLPKGISLFSGLISPETWKWQGLVVGIVTMAIMGASPKITKKLPGAILGLLGGVCTYFILAAFYPDLLNLKENSLIIGPIETSGSFLNAVVEHFNSLFHLSFSTIKQVFVPALTLSVLLSIDTLKTCVGLDALTRNRHHSDRELIGQGIGNLASFFVGGMPGAGTMGPTLVNVTSGGRSPRAGIIEGIFVLLAILLLGHFIAWVPIASLAGILLVIAWRMFDRTMFRLLRYPAGRLDFAIIAGVIIVALTVDLIAASGFGILLAVILFIRDQILGTVIFQKLYLNQISSKTQRQLVERDLLNLFGDQAVVCKLQGNLFFGTTDQLYTQLEEDLRKRRFILLDFRRVLSLDFTAVHLFELMHHQLEERGGQLIFSGMPSGTQIKRDFERYLSQMGLVKEHGGVMISETLDGALEWMEDQILLANGLNSNKPGHLLELQNFPLFRDFNDNVIANLSDCIGETSIQRGQKLFSRGDSGDEIFLVRRGCVRVLLPLAGGKRHHLATIGPGGFFGELSFLDRDLRSADVEAKDPTDLFIFSRSKFNQLCLKDPAIGAQVFARLALVAAQRLRTTDAELRHDSDR